MLCTRVHDDIIVIVMMTMPSCALALLHSASLSQHCWLLQAHGHKQQALKYLSNIIDNIAAILSMVTCMLVSHLKLATSLCMLFFGSVPSGAGQPAYTAFLHSIYWVYIM